ncbi:MAG: site-2 protease family protein [Prevotella sp.]|nr:site-2 protease family protein [Prevotella sp.]MBQ9669063.1 site-2 protease family protein [Prevotella sp.]
MEVFLIRLLQFLLAISLLVLLHELGHFTFAKIFKVRVTKFYLFFNPKFHILSTYDTWVRRLFKMKPEVVPTKEVTVEQKEGEEPKKETVKEYVGTEYGLGWLPLGGYCAIDGMIDETNQKLSEETHPWEFRTKPTWQRLLIMIGGVLVNFLLALFIYSMILFHWGETYIPVEKMTDGMKFNAEAKALGFEDHDILVSTDRGPLKKFDDDLFRQVSKARQVNVIRQGQPFTINIPESADLNLLNMFKATPMFMRPFLPAVVDSVMPGTPAAEIGLQPGDSILAINGKTVDSHNEFTYEIERLSDVLATAKTAADSLKVRSIDLVIWRAEQAALATDSVPYVGDTLQAVLTPELQLGFVTMSKYEPTTFRYGFLESIPAGISYGWHKLSGYVSDMKYVFTSEGAKSLGGFGAIGSLFPEVWDWHRFWEMTAFLSIILAFMNILPIPALDGGHVLFLLYEMITRRKPSDQFMIRAEYVGFGILILLMVVANLNDILRWLGYM